MRLLINPQTIAINNIVVPASPSASGVTRINGTVFFNGSAFVYSSGYGNCSTCSSSATSNFDLNLGLGAGANTSALPCLYYTSNTFVGGGAGGNGVLSQSSCYGDLACSGAQGQRVSAFGALAGVGLTGEYGVSSCPAFVSSGLGSVFGSFAGYGCNLGYALTAIGSNAARNLTDNGLGSGTIPGIHDCVGTGACENAVSRKTSGNAYGLTCFASSACAGVNGATKALCVGPRTCNNLTIDGDANAIAIGWNVLQDNTYDHVVAVGFSQNTALPTAANQFVIDSSLSMYLTGSSRQYCIKDDTCQARDSAGVWEDVGSRLTNGYLGVGLSSAPSNTGTGDITGSRLHLGTDASFADANTILELAGTLPDNNKGYLRVAPTMTGNTSSLYNAITANYAVAPTGAVASSGYLGVRVLNTVSPSAAGTITQIASFSGIPTLDDSTATVTSLLGAVVAPTVASGFGGTVTNVFGYHVSAISVQSNATIALVAVFHANPALSGSQAVTLFAGADLGVNGNANTATVAQLRFVPATTGTNKYGILSASNTASLAAGLAFGTGPDAGIYRSTTATLKVEGPSAAIAHLTVTGDVTARHQLCTANVPSIACGAGAGSGATCTLTAGTDCGGTITIATAGTPTGAAAVIFTVTFTAAFPNNADAIVFSPANGNASGLVPGTTAIRVGTATSTTFTLVSGATALTTGTTYIWTFTTRGS